MDSLPRGPLRCLCMHEYMQFVNYYRIQPNQFISKYIYISIDSNARNCMDAKL